MNHESLIDFLLELKEHQISVSVRDGNLVVSRPTGRMPEKLLVSVKDRKKEILQFLENCEEASLPDIEAIGEQADFETSPSQQRIWMFQHLDSSGRAYNIPGAYLLEGELDRLALQASLNCLVARHEILRTTFIHRDGEIRQIVHDPFICPIQETDLTSDMQWQSQLDQIIGQSLEVRFDLTTLPLFAIHLVRFAVKRTLVIFNLHHIICDGISLALIARELFARDGSPCLEMVLAPQIQYRDYSAWINRLLLSGSLEGQKKYWQHQLGGGSGYAKLPNDFPRSARMGRDSLVETFALSTEEAKQFHELAASNRCSVFNCLVAFTSLVFYRLTGDGDIRLGTPVVGRPHPDLQEQIGCHINLVVLRNRFQGSTSLEALLHSVQSTTVDAFAHQLYPFELLAGKLIDRGEPGQNPLFDVLITLQEEPQPFDGKEGTRFTPYPIRSGIGSGRFDLTFGFEDSASGIRLNLEYLAALFEEASIRKFGSQFLEVVRCGLADPRVAVADLAGNGAGRLLPNQVPVAPPRIAEQKSEPADAPLSETQILFLETLQDVLRTPDLTINDHYFESGGDSIRAIQTIARLGQRGLGLEMTDFFVFPRIRDLSSRIQFKGRETGSRLGMNLAPADDGMFLPPDLDEGEMARLLSKYPDWDGKIESVTFLSPVQEGIMFHSLSQPDSSFYQVRMTLTLRGRILPEIFGQAWCLLIERHGVLRARFVPGNAIRPLQVILKPSAPGASYRFHDLRCHDVATQERLWCQARRSEEQRGLALDGDSLIRITLCQMSDSEFTVLLANHQIILDGWSVSALFREFTHIYSSLAASRPVQQSTGSSYSTYVRWVERNATDAQRQYWQKYLAEFRFPSVFPFKKAESGTSVAKLYFEMGPALTSQLVGFGKEQTATLSTVLQVIWGILLGKYNESNDVVFGLVVSIRPPEIFGIEHSLGMYVNTVPVRMNLFSERSFRDVVVLCQNRVLEGWAHHHFSLYEIFKTTPLQNRLFDHLFIFQNYPMSETDTSAPEEFRFEAGNLEISEHVHYGLVIEIRPGSTLRMTFEYDETTYDRRDLERLANQFLVLTRKLISRPDQRIADISLLELETEKRLRESIAKEQSLFSHLGNFNFDDYQNP